MLLDEARVDWKPVETVESISMKRIRAHVRVTNRINTDRRTEKFSAGLE